MSLSNNYSINTIICNEKKEVDLDALNLLASGKIDNLCSCSYKYKNKHHHFIYDVDDLIPLSQLQAGLSFENVVDILSSAICMIQDLIANNLLLDNIKNAKEYVFKTDEGYKFIYIPIARKAHVDIKDYIIDLMAVIHHKDDRLNKFIKGLRKKKGNDQTLSFITAFVSSCEDCYAYSGEVSLLMLDEGETSLLSCEGETSLLNNDSSILEDETSVLSNDGETTLLGQTNSGREYDAVNTESNSARLTEYFHDESGEYETTVLSSQPVSMNQFESNKDEREHCLYLCRNLNGEKITVDVTPFSIGKDSVNMDLVINNESVSRHHATIIYEDGDYYIMDNESTNGTTIEGVKLQPGEKGEIGNGYIISLGNESFQASIISQK